MKDKNTSLLLDKMMGEPMAKINELVKEAVRLSEQGEKIVKKREEGEKNERL